MLIQPDGYADPPRDDDDRDHKNRNKTSCTPAVYLPAANRNPMPMALIICIALKKREFKDRARMLKYNAIRQASV